MVKRLAGKYLIPYMRQLGAALVFMVVASAMTAGFAWLIEPVFDKVLVEQRKSLIVPMAFAVFVCFLVRGLASYVHTLLMNRIGQCIVADIQRDLFSSLLHLDLRFFHGNPSGQLVSRIISDVQAVRGAVSDTLTGMGRNLLTLIFLIILMFYQDWKLALISFFAFPFAAIFVSWIGKRLRKISKKIQAETGTLTALLIQIFQGVRQVKAYDTEAFEQQRSSAAIDKVRDLNIKAIRVATLATPFNETLLGIAVMAVITYGGYQVSAGMLTVGELTSFITAFALAYEPMKRLAKLNNTLQIGLGAGERIFEMMDRQPDIKDKPDAGELAVKKPAITFDNVSFGYGLDEGHALKDVSFKIPAGKVTALVGPSGSGKTTAMNLVARFYDVLEGQIRIDGVDIRDVTLSSLRAHIALVSQDVTIFDDTVKANIAYGRPDVSEEDIHKAAQAAAADEFILQMQDGYETRLGEQGVKLSGGQRQRIAIARAILRDAPILLLDEATSALDTESERAIQKSLESLQKGRTVLVIAHRLSTVQQADQIIVLEDGHIRESGNHAELVAEKGLYARMYKAGLEE
ncbi:MAG: ABC transporter ATP-binding protein [Rhodospirillales bacterium]|nr:ABC transporter ATP-binding protein [Rhodospirillales bacterium]MCB9995773.1 ABC transporter ATP-binding protein [Rhodospirillales bacterium]